MTRLINADALDAEMYHKSFEVDDGRNVWNSGLWIRYKIFEEAIRDAPTIDAMPVMHAQWIIKEDPVFADKYYCSNCGEQANVDLYGEWILSKYCPNCGARMDAERKEPNTHER